VNSVAELKKIPNAKKSKNVLGSAEEAIKSRRSKELIIGICGAIGAGSKDLADELNSALSDSGYKVETVKISEIIYGKRHDTELAGLSGYEKYDKYQTAGNEIRKGLGPSYLAEAAIEEIVEKRDKYVDTGNSDESGKTTERVAYIIDQLKHPAEATLLKTVYRQNFYLIGINSTKDVRKSNLENIAISAEDADKLIRRDRKEKDKHGQQVEDTFSLADYFIHNKQSSSNLKKAIQRFIDLVHGVNGKTPTKDEKGMYEAFSASLQSACLSRQVGASIMDQEGDIVSTGCNDVPAFGGGLYTAEHGDEDRRCIFKGKKCYNDLHKNKLQKQFEEILEDISFEASDTEQKQFIIDADYVKKKLKDKIKNEDMDKYIL